MTPGVARMSSCETYGKLPIADAEHRMLPGGPGRGLPDLRPPGAGRLLLRARGVDRLGAGQDLAAEVRAREERDETERDDDQRDRLLAAGPEHALGPGGEKKSPRTSDREVAAARERREDRGEDRKQRAVEEHARAASRLGCEDEHERCDDELHGGEEVGIADTALRPSGLEQVDGTGSRAAMRTRRPRAPRSARRRR